MVQRQKIVKVVPFVEKLDPSACRFAVLLCHRPRSISPLEVPLS
jgi:hypothetical protein